MVNHIKVDYMPDPQYIACHCVKLQCHPRLFQHDIRSYVFIFFKVSDVVRRIRFVIAGLWCVMHVHMQFMVNMQGVISEYLLLNKLMFRAW